MKSKPNNDTLYKPNGFTIYKGLLVKFSYSRWLPSSVRIIILKIAGVRFIKSHNVFIGSCVSFDTHYPELIEIGDNVQITSGCTLLTHKVDLTSQNFRSHSLGEIKLGDNVFIGCNTIIFPNVSICSNTVIGAGSVVSKSITTPGVYINNKFLKKIESVC